jgi:hypothetical protein
MKKRIILILLTAILTVSLFITGCTTNSEPNFGATGAKVYEPSLSAMSDEAIRIKVDELYDDILNGLGNLVAEETLSLIQVYQNELILRQLEALNQASFDESDKQLPQSRHKKLGIKWLEHKKGLKGLQSKQGLKGLPEKQGVKNK